MYGMSYKRGQERIVAFLADKDPDVVVPACPDWSATDVVRHLTGLSSDITNDVFEGFASEEWTDKQVSDRADMSLEEVASEWRGSADDAGARLESLASVEDPKVVPSALGSVPVTAFAPMAINDLLHHEFDLRNAYGDRTGRDLPEVAFAAAGHARALRGAFTQAGMPTLRIEATDTGQGWNIGRDEPIATVRASSFELMRSIGGRRTRDEMLALDWEGDGELFVDAMVLAHLSMRETSLDE